MTGRLATSNPNMQSVPAHDERGRLFRAAFTADEGHVLVAADYSQVTQTQTLLVLEAAVRAIITCEGWCCQQVVAGGV